MTSLGRGQFGLNPPSRSPKTTPGATGLPAGLRLPSVLQTAAWIRYPTRMLDWCQARYGDTFTLHFVGLGPLVFTSDPEGIREVLLDSGERLHAGEGNLPLRPILGPQSLLLLDGEQHLAQRRILLPLFHGARIPAYGEIISNIARKRTENWSPEASISVHPEMQAVSLQVIMHAVFGLSEGPRYTRFLELLTRFTEYLSGSFIYFPGLQHEWYGLTPWARFKRTAEELYRLLDEEISDRVAGDLEAKADILSLLLRTRSNVDEPLSRRLVREQLITLLAAGHETTATALVWALNHVLRYPEVAERLKAELEDAGPDKGPEHYAALPFLEAVCNETLRLYPIVPVIGRKIKEPFRLLDYDLPADVTIIPCIYLAHRRPDLYRDPSQFRPERFLERQYRPHEFLPFGGGIRRCIGGSFALYEMKIILGTVLSRYELRLARSRPIDVQRRNVTLYPRGGTHVTVMHRRW